MEHYLPVRQMVREAVEEFGSPTTSGGRACTTAPSTTAPVMAPE